MSEISIHKLLDLRQEARNNKNWKLSDEIRNQLDNLNVFVFDTPKGQEVYFPSKKSSRQEIIQKIKDDIKYNAIFDSWLYSQSKSK